MHVGNFWRLEQIDISQGPRILSGGVFLGGGRSSGVLGKEGIASGSEVAVAFDVQAEETPGLGWLQTGEKRRRIKNVRQVQRRSF